MNHIDSVVREILHYTETDIHSVTFYKNILTKYCHKNLKLNQNWRLPPYRPLGGFKLGGGIQPLSFSI